MMQCSPKAFAKCPHRHLCIGDATFTKGSDCHKFNVAVDNQPVTNGEKIRSLSDAELAGYLMAISTLECPFGHECLDSCSKCWMQHLSAPYDGGLLP